MDILKLLWSAYYQGNVKTCLEAACQVYNELVTGLQIELANICHFVLAGENELVKVENNATLSHRSQRREIGKLCIKC